MKANLSTILVTLIIKIADALRRLVNETEITGAEIAVMVQATAWSVVLALPITSPLLPHLTRHAPEWVWGLAFSVAAFGHLTLLIVLHLGTHLLWNLKARNVLCFFDVGLWSTLAMISNEARVYFNSASCVAMVIVAAWAMWGLGLRIVGYERRQ